MFQDQIHRHYLELLRLFYTCNNILSMSDVERGSGHCYFVANTGPLGTKYDASLVEAHEILNGDW